jgi:hypothetical protein
MTEENIKRPMDEMPCDWCGSPLLLGARVYVDLARGTAYCCMGCARQDEHHEPVEAREWTVEEILKREG